MPFKKGQSGNPNGRPKGSDRLFREALDVAIKRVEGEKGDKKTKLARIAEALVEKAITGDVPAINAVADRLDGKPTQIIAGDPDSPFTVMHEAGRTLDAKLERLIGRGTRKA